MSVKINWNYSDYSDVESVVICRSKDLNNEKAFEDSLNGLGGAQPTVLSTISASSLTAGAQSYSDIIALDPSTTYYYCVAAKGPGSNGLYKVGPSTSEASTTVVTNLGDGTSSVAAFTTDDGTSSNDLFSVTSINYLNYNGDPVDRSQLLSSQAEIDKTLTAFEDALNWLRMWVSLPTGGQTHRITLNISEAMDRTALASMHSTGLYSINGPTTEPIPFGQAFTRDGLLNFNMPLSMELAYKVYNRDSSGEPFVFMDPELAERFYYHAFVHELVHMMGMNALVMDINGGNVSNAPITSSGESNPGYIFRGVKATKEYKRYMQEYTGYSESDMNYILGVPLQNTASTQNQFSGAEGLYYHWEEGGNGYPIQEGNEGTIRYINGGPYYAPELDVISGVASLVVDRVENMGSYDAKFYLVSADYTTRLALGFFQDVGYIIDWSAFEALEGCDVSPFVGGLNNWDEGRCVDPAVYPYPT